ncbi:hypothetical protein ACS19Z_05430 [Klebsiella pneumoniae]|uniref:hypothetical protein n=1 Tax=Klebsiella pneumoniae TaxID=573 RepID=UPI003F6A5792
MSQLVTGVIVLGDCLKVRNEQHRLMARDIEYWKIIKDVESARKKHSIAKTLFWSFAFNGELLKQRYKSKAPSLKFNTCKSKILNAVGVRQLKN